MSRLLRGDIGLKPARKRGPLICKEQEVFLAVRDPHHLDNCLVIRAVLRIADQGMCATGRIDLDW